MANTTTSTENFLNYTTIVADFYAVLDGDEMHTEKTYAGSLADLPAWLWEFCCFAGGPDGMDAGWYDSISCVLLDNCAPSRDLSEAEEMDRMEQISDFIRHQMDAYSRQSPRRGATGSEQAVVLAGYREWI